RRRRRTVGVLCRIRPLCRAGRLLGDRALLRSRLLRLVTGRPLELELLPHRHTSNCTGATWHRPARRPTTATRATQSGETITAAPACPDEDGTTAYTGTACPNSCPSRVHTARRAGAIPLPAAPPDSRRARARAVAWPTLTRTSVSTPTSRYDSIRPPSAAATDAAAARPSAAPARAAASAAVRADARSTAAPPIRPTNT